MNAVFLRFVQEAKMNGSEKEYRQGFAAGWLAASQAIMAAMISAPEAPPAPLAFAGNLPPTVRRRRGRPPKSMSMAQSALQQPVKRRRGRPRKTA
jgi:hypothetical protein